MKVLIAFIPAQTDTREKGEDREGKREREGEREIGGGGERKKERNFSYKYSLLLNIFFRNFLSMLSRAFFRTTRSGVY